MATQWAAEDGKVGPKKWFTTDKCMIKISDLKFSQSCHHMFTIKKKEPGKQSHRIYQLSFLLNRLILNSFHFLVDSGKELSRNSSTAFQFKSTHKTQISRISKWMAENTKKAHEASVMVRFVNKGLCGPLRSFIFQTEVRQFRFWEQVLRNMPWVLLLK